MMRRRNPDFSCGIRSNSGNRDALRFFQYSIQILTLYFFCFLVIFKEPIVVLAEPYISLNVFVKPQHFRTHRIVPNKGIDKPPLTGDWMKYLNSAKLRDPDVSIVILFNVEEFRRF